MMKLPDNLRSVFKPGEPLSEEAGEGLARWAEGKQNQEEPAEAAGPSFSSAMLRVESAASDEELKRVIDGIAATKDGHFSKEQKTELRSAVKKQKEVLRGS
jgi:hypothetical protein